MGTSCLDEYGVVIHPSADPETQMGQSVHSDDKSLNIM